MSTWMRGKEDARGGEAEAEAATERASARKKKIGSRGRESGRQEKANEAKLRHQRAELASFFLHYIYLKSFPFFHLFLSVLP